jgi:hypothetical protein
MLAAEAHSFDMKLDRFRDQVARLLEGAARSDTPREVRHIGGPVVIRLLKDDRVLLDFFSPAFFSIEFSVPAGRSSPGWPGMVTVPASGLAGWRYCL